MIFTTRDLDILRFLRWCRFVLAKDLTGVFSKGEVQNLEILRLIQLYSPAQAYTEITSGLTHRVCPSLRQGKKKSRGTG